MDALLVVCNRCEPVVTRQDIPITSIIVFTSNHGHLSKVKYEIFSMLDAFHGGMYGDVRFA